MASTTVSPSETIGMGCVGVGGRGLGLLRFVLEVKGVQVIAVCDSVPENLARASSNLDGNCGSKNKDD